ncbi:MAG: hypothetical protein L6M37_03895 [Candidatus Methylarchaceae archaeon HK02M1]|nr:hypothetical protein [Candidatus Methylarchaceae archaeon HK02M1]
MGLGMTSESNGDGKSTGKAQQIKEARMLASRLQRAIDTGRSTLIKMREVDKLVSNRLTTQTAYILKTIDNLGGKTQNSSKKGKLNKIYLKLLDLFNEFKLMEARGYKTMVRSRNIVDAKRLDELIDVDTELLSAIALLFKLASKISSKKSISLNMCKEILYMIDDLFLALRKRYEIIGAVD